MVQIVGLIVAALLFGHVVSVPAVEEEVEAGGTSTAVLAADDTCATQDCALSALQAKALSKRASTVGVHQKLAAMLGKENATTLHMMLRKRASIKEVQQTLTAMLGEKNATRATHMIQEYVGSGTLDGVAAGKNTADGTAAGKDTSPALCADGQPVGSNGGCPGFPSPGVLSPVDAALLLLRVVVRAPAATALDFPHVLYVHVLVDLARAVLR